MRRLEKKRLLLWGLTVGIMLVIFFLSAQSKAASSDLSMNVRGWFSSVLRCLGLHRYAESALLHKFVRKCAHAFLYACLGLSTACSMRSSVRRKPALWAILFCFFYAVSDEVHQAFVPGRGPLWTDVVLDTLSSMTGIGFVWCLRKKFAGKRHLKAD